MGLATVVFAAALAAAGARQRPGGSAIAGPDYGPESRRSGVYPAAPASLGNGSAAVAARALRRRNGEALAAILARLGGGGERALCGGPFPARRDDAPLQWLHYPKCGSTFATTFARHACDGLAARGDVFLGAPRPADVPGSGPSLGTSDLAAVAQRLCGGAGGTHRVALLRSATLGESLRMFAGHSPLTPGRKARYQAAIFRRPSQRVLSAFHFDRHVWGSEMRSRDGTVAGKHLMRWRDWLKRRPVEPYEFAASPGVAGCSARMNSGCFCAARPREVDPSTLAAGRPRFEPEQEVACAWGWKTMDAPFRADAADRVAHFAFVGLQEAYNASVCLFHRKHGGEPAPVEFARFNVGYGRGATAAARAKLRRQKFGLSTQKAVPAWDEADLGDFVDVHDEVVYAAALGRFAADLDVALADDAPKARRARGKKRRTGAS